MKYHHGNLKEELILSACAICEADGHDHMSLRSIAKEARVSQTAPYRHFKTKNYHNCHDPGTHLPTEKWK